MTLRHSPILRSTWKRLLACKRRTVCFLKCLRASPEDLVHFQCNICGIRTSFLRAEMGREVWSCWHCASTVRWRSVIHALSTTLFGRSLAIDDFPERPDIAGAGLSDWEGYAERLAKKLGYNNTFYHQEPLLDITDVDAGERDQFDFIISSDVFEHICPPISKAFRNAYELLKPGGTMIFTVPYLPGETREYFPEVRKFSVQRDGANWVLLGSGSDGRDERFTGLTFHGGPGTVVEFRVFGESSLRRDCEAAGFGPVRVFAEAVPEFGICWNRYIPEMAPYRPLIYGLDTPPWALVKASSQSAAEDVEQETALA